MIEMKPYNNLKKLLLFFSLLVGIYFLFSLGTVAYTLYSGTIFSSNLKPKIWHNKDKADDKLVIGIISPFRGGEFNQAIMVKESAERLGHSAYVYVFNDLDMNMFIPAKYINALMIKLFDFIYKTDFHLAMSFHVNLDISEPKIMYISVPKEYLISRNTVNMYPKITEYNNFIDINLMNQNESVMTELLGRKVNAVSGIVGFPQREYISSNRQKLLMFGSLWGRGADNFYQALVKLAKQDYMYFVRSKNLLLGLNQRQEFAPAAPNLKSLIERMNQYGIVLCTHSHFHVEASIPSSRIFEIISSGAIAISDKNPFVMKYFGNNVLYFDQTAPTEEIFTQIDNHVRWVQSHPKEAEVMARNAFQILQDNFSTEKFVNDAISLYKKTLSK